jgi:phosphoribosylanthranilate isomerase
MSIWTKICGITRVSDAMDALEAGADALGLNFVSESPRACGLDRAREITEAVGSRATVYGIFADLSRKAIARVIEQTGVSGIQLHGSEKEELSIGWSLPVIRAVQVRERVQVEAAADMARRLSAHGAVRILLDSPRGGGSGERFDQEVVVLMDLSEMIVAGGLTPANVGDVATRLRPFGVDTASGVETRPGIKDVNLMKEFINHARSA